MSSCRRPGHRRLLRGVGGWRGRTVHGAHDQRQATRLEESELVLVLVLEEDEGGAVVPAAVVSAPKKKTKVCAARGRAWVLLGDCESIDG